MSSNNCPLCSHKNREALEEELAKGLPKTIVSKDLDIDVKVIETHMQEHFSAGLSMSDDDAQLDTDLDYMVSFEERDSYQKHDILQTNMKRLVDKFDGVMQRDGWEKEDIENIVKLAREVRQTAMSLADLEGEIKEELKLTEKQFNELKGVILRVVQSKCPNCGHELEQMQKIVEAIDPEQIKIEASK